MFSFGCHLVGCQLGDKFIPPSVMVFRVVDNRPTFFAIVNHDMVNVGAWQPLMNALNPVVLKFSF